MRSILDLVEIKADGRQYFGQRLFVHVGFLVKEVMMTIIRLSSEISYLRLFLVNEINDPPAFLG